MNCPICSSHSRVIDSRLTQNNIIRRNRECTKCHERWTTYEIDSVTYDLLDEFKNTTERMIDLYEDRLKLLARR